MAYVGQLPRVLNEEEMMRLFDTCMSNDNELRIAAETEVLSYMRQPQCLLLFLNIMTQSPSVRVSCDESPDNSALVTVRSGKACGLS